MKSSTPYSILCLFLFMLISSFLFAQPEKNEHLDHVGCKYFRNQIKLEPLTDYEKNILDASAERSDTIDILNFGITLEVLNFSSKIINGFCEVTFTPKMDNVNYIDLDLEELTIDSILHNDVPISFDYDGLLIHVNLPTTYNINDTTAVTVFYHGQPTVDASEFGGFDFRGGYAYNLGIGLSSNPYNFGRSWFPCFDNFVERSTYDFNIITKGNNRAYCTGDFLGETIISGDTIMRSYRMDKQITTYLAGVAISNYTVVNQSHTGANGELPIILLSKPSDVSGLTTSFAELGGAIDALEYWFGPYVWGQVGYVMVARGAMEHPTLIAYPDFVGVEGNNANQRGLMAHELAHHWWGDLVTLPAPSDMWFKEGNAEYGAHLFVEYNYGREEFINTVKRNFHNDVLKNAHLDDGDYLPLSGIPFENTYGTHTYNKGASMIHNLRAYLGDSLYRVANISTMNTFAYDAIDAGTFRDHMTAVTGIDMNPFFDAWIYNPGYVSYEIDDVEVEATGGVYDVTVHIQQKLYHAPNFHTDTPIEITFMDQDWNKEVRQIMVSGEFSTIDLTLPFEPTAYFLNEAHKLNLACFGANNLIEEAGDLAFPFINSLGFSVSDLSDSAYLHVEHYWVAPDPIINNPFNATISNSHYWRVEGIIPDVFEANALWQYSGANENTFDYDLLDGNSDDLILIYRATPNDDWKKYPYYETISFTNSSGLISVTNILLGEYTFAKGELDLFVANKEIKDDIQFEVSPNPFTDVLNIELEDFENEWQVEIRDLNTHIVYQKDNINTTRLAINLKNLTAGVYVVLLRNKKGQIIAQERIVNF